MRRIRSAIAPEALDGRWDASFYRDWNVDLRAQDEANLRKHWHRHGARENRHANLEELLAERELDVTLLGPEFEWRVYLGLYPDLGKAGIDSRAQAIVHFLEHGVLEGRDGDFNHDFYTGFYPDLLQFSEDRETAIDHWVEHGCMEGRSPTLRHYVATHGGAKESVSADLEAGPLSMRTNGRMDWERLVRALVQDPPGPAPLWGNEDRDASFYLELAGALMRSGEDQKASRLYVALSGLYPGSAHCALGNISMREGLEPGIVGQRQSRMRLALAHYRAALRHAPDSLDAMLGESRALIETACHRSALEAAERALVAYPDRSEAEVMLETAATAFWRNEWAESTCVALEGERERLHGMALEATRRAGAAYHLQTLRGRDEEARVRIARGPVLIVTDCNLPQCVRYRIDQKVEQLQLAGHSPDVVSWRDQRSACGALAVHDIVIFYRVPAFPEVVQLIASARALGKVTFFEIDDFVFDPMYPPPIDTYGGFVDAHEYVELMKGGALYHAAAAMCDFGIASTEPLCERLRAVVRRQRCHLHRNALDRLSRTQLVPGKEAAQGGETIFYGSATRAHNSDFTTLALPALERVMDEFPSARLLIVGYLRLPRGVRDAWGARIVEVPMVESFAEYQEVLAMADINLAVLEPNVLTDCKSEIKWLEAGVMGIPSIVSPTRNYRDTVRDGVDGILAASPDDWYHAIASLMGNPDARRRIGAAARKRALSEYGVESMARRLSVEIHAAVDLVEARPAGREVTHG